MAYRPELTKVHVKMLNGGSEDETPDAVVVRLTDEALCQCPITFMEDAGTAHFTAIEVGRPAPRSGLRRVPAKAVPT